AAKFTPDHGRIHLEAARDGPEVAIRVRDNGSGISANMLPYIFDLFTQGDPSLDHSHGGLGIGLTLVERLVQMHGGTVEARSDGPGRGSEFIVRLPALPPSQRDNAASFTKPRLHRLGHRVLVVEDNKDAAESLALVLKMGGAEVRIALSGPAALELAAD